MPCPPRLRRIAALVLSGCLLLSPTVPATETLPLPAAASDPAGTEAPEPKFFWGILLNVAFKLAMTAFGDWLAQKKLSDQLTQTSELEKIMLNMAHAMVVPLVDVVPFATKASFAENTRSGEPGKPLTLENGRENYQGVHVALVGFDATGRVQGLRPVSDGFRSGDRIKLKILPTFDCLVVVDAQNASSHPAQLYPPRIGDVVKLEAGREYFLPLGRDEFFEFTGPTGDETLRLTIRHPRAFGVEAAQTPAERKDDASGTRFLQETVAGRYPVIAQNLVLRHQ